MQNEELILFLQSKINSTMKKAILLTLISLSLCVASFSQEKAAEPKVKQLTYSEFIKNIWNFEKSPEAFVYKGKLPAVVDFYADWCGPCRMVGPIMEKMANEYDGKLLVYKVNVDQEKELASVFGVRSIPMVLFIPVEGKPMAQTGALKEDQYRQIIEKELIK